MLSTSCIVSVDPPWMPCRPTEDVLDAGAQDALVVEPAVLVEAAVLDRDRRLLQRLRDLVAVDGGPQHVRVDVAERGSVSCEYLRELARIARLQLG